MAKNTPTSRAEDKAAAAQRREARKQKAAAQAAAAEAARVARQRKERITVGAIVAVVLALVVGVAWWAVRDSGPVAAPKNVVDSYALAVGDPDAEHVVEIHEDFLCPACAWFEGETNEDLTAAAEAGKVYVKYLPINFLSRFGDYSERATNAFAVVLDAAGPEVAKTFHDSLFAAQPAENGNKPDDDWLVEKAVAAGADEDAVRDGIEEMAFEGWVAEATDAASKAGIRSTPTVVVDGTVLENNDPSTLMGMIN
ncbi:DsbA family protein [Nocardioides yefusunii]|uniref:DsbA family protein n=1 Tax=Nocardioides yefusunii TaxID=2500546 RepID=A0ABW1QVN9_9ACTN|nr:thioredoxin domain-containing protein [Nocardioides yefusunii]